jgi:hypothetical protein
VTRKWRYSLVAIAVIGCAVLVAGWLGQNFRRTLMLTTADPDAIGLALSDSMQPITLTLESDYFADAPHQRIRAPTKQRLSFKIPAAYAAVIDLKEGSGGSQRLAFEVWSRTFDPIAVDIIADRRKCRVGEPCRSEPGTRVWQRWQAGEASTYIQISNSAGTEMRRNRSLADLDSVKGNKPCKITEDAELGMTVAEAPDGVRPGDACDFIGNPSIRTRDGKSFPPKNFIRRRADGAAGYLVRCQKVSSEPEEQAEIRCRLYLYFGAWPVSVLFFGIAPKDWDDLSERVRKFLAQHAIERTS